MAEYTKTAMEQLTAEPFIRTDIGSKLIELWSPWTKPNTSGNWQTNKAIRVAEEMAISSRQSESV